ncbi:MAG TPA: MlrC family protein 3 [Rhodospirillaceae bacterium]|nr:MlrC family protein 3 [Rhodospirillaceae bacterium]
MARIGIVSIMLEVNSFCPVTTEEDFKKSCYLVGEEILEEAAKDAPILAREIKPFIKTMNETGDWTPVPTICTYYEPWGPIDEGFFKRYLADVRKMLEDAAPLDGVYICNHGAMAATHDEDPDGELYEMVRDVVGPEIPVVVTVDLHANISERMIDNADIIISYKTNPHVDQPERATEAAHILRRMLEGERFAKARVRLPITPPSVRLLTAPRGTYADAIRAATKAQEENDDLVSVSVVGSFSFADLSKCGLTAMAYGEQAAVDEITDRLAPEIWAGREDFLVRLTPIEDAVAQAVAAGQSGGAKKVCLADVADNPGGGGCGNTTGLLLPLIEAGVENVCFGLFSDPAVAAEAHENGIGAKFEATFNREPAYDFTETFTREVEVLALSDGFVPGRRGCRAGRTMKIGPAAALKLGGMTLLVISRRMQMYDPALIEAFGLDIASFSTVALKSRGHFRAGFDIFFENDEIFEVDAPGMTTPVLTRFDWKALPRPCYPVDEDAVWDLAKS